MQRAEAIRRDATPLTGSDEDHAAIVRAGAEADFVLIGEASHGTQDFYAERARITRRLITEAEFSAVAVEADWPDAYRVNCYARGTGDDASARSALDGFRRFPTWMWRNTVVEEFVGWLRERNNALSEERRAGFYGLDLYSMYTSAEAVLRYLDRTDPAAAARARRRYACFDPFGDDPQAYGYTATRFPDESCEDAVVHELLELREHASEYAATDGGAAADAYFHAEQNARLVRNAEAYYRTMFRGSVASWNLRDEHMCETLYALRDHLARQGTRRPRIVVWAHNSHLGDARATQMGAWGEWNVGQLVRERSGDAAVLVGFTTFAGTVTAARDWDEPAELRRVQPALPGSYERLLHDTGMAAFSLSLRHGAAAGVLEEPLLERAIGVIYRPESERASHYFDATLASQFDFVIHLDETHALAPLERGSRWTEGEVPETFPTGM